MTTDQARVLPFAGTHPTLHEQAILLPGTTVIGDATVEADANLWYGAVVRADVASIRVGAGSNLQDGVIVHADPDLPTDIGAGVTVGHGAVVHGATVEDTCLIGMRSVVLNGARVGAGALIAAGAVVTEGTVVPPGTLVAGVPGKVRRELTEEEQAGLVTSWQGYVELARAHQSD